MDLRGLKGRSSRLLLAGALLLVLTAALLPSTLAWFSQRLSSPGSRISSGEAAGVQLWVQTADEAGGFAALDDSAFGAGHEEYLAPVQEADGSRHPAHGQLCLLSDRERPLTAQDPSDPHSGYNRLFCDSGLLPGDTISRRLIVRSEEETRLSYVLAFSDDGTGSLGEALRVELTRFPGGPLPLLDGNQLLARTFEGVLEPGGFEIYELRLTFLPGAGGWYEGASFHLGAEAWAFSGGAVRPVRSGQELADILNSPDLADGDTVAVLEDISVERFCTERMINLTIAPGKTLTVQDLFEVVLRPGEDGQSPFGTMDVAYGEENGLLAVGAENIFLEAPGVAFRWSRKSALPLAENCRIRSLNGEQLRPK